MIRVPYNDLFERFHRVLFQAGLAEDRAELVARLFAENQRDGVYSHGLNRFPRLVERIRSKEIDAEANPEKVREMGTIEQWDGHMGIGLWNAHICMDQAVELARRHGIGCVGLRNTNHWMRGGSYGLQAADAGCIGICWTNTTTLMPPWGSAEVKIGNNPMAVAVPRPNGPILLDMAMSQYSNGKLEVLRSQGKTLPLPGGYDEAGNLTAEPGAILQSRRALPIGYWKGSGLALILDLMAALLSGGQSTHLIARQESEYAVSQAFFAVDVTTLMGKELLHKTVEGIIRDFQSAEPMEESGEVRYPGEGMMRTREESLEKGVLVDEKQWQSLIEASGQS